MDPRHDRMDEPAAEHVPALLPGLAAALLGALVWSGAAAVFNEWSLVAAPGVGWLAAWGCSHGARRPDDFSRRASWVLGALGILAGLLAYCAFSAARSAPGSGLTAGVLAAGWFGLLAAPPWFGPAAVLLALAGVARALAGQRTRPAVATLAPASGARVAPAGPDRESRAA